LILDSMRWLAMVAAAAEVVTEVEAVGGGEVVVEVDLTIRTVLH